MNPNTSENTFPYSFLKFLNTPGLPLKLFMLAIILLTMYNNLEHSASVYLNISDHTGHSDAYNRFQSYLVVIVFDLAVIAFILKSKNTESKVFAWVLFLINCLFFNVIQTGYQIIFLLYNIQSDVLKQDQEVVKMLITDVNAVIAKVVFAAIFSYCIHRFSHLWYDELKHEDYKKAVFEYQRVIQELQEVRERDQILGLEHLQEKNALRAEIQRMVQELDQVKDELKVAELERNEFRNKLTRKKNSEILEGMIV
jgi:hypothetical protein